MDINSLLGAPKACECGKTHGCDIKSVVIEKNAVAKIPELAKGYKGVLLVADRNTYRVCGKDVEALGIHKDIFVFEEEGLVIPNEKAWGEIQSRVTDEIDLIIGIGSGVIQDLCKYVSFLCKIDYFIVATAPSMDGYASVGAAMIANDMKVTFSAHVPKAIIADTEVLKDAPMEMIVAGYGDIIGKYSCLNDWKLSALVNGEYFCQSVYDLMMSAVKAVRPLSKKLLERDGEAVGALMEALVVAGIAMSLVGNSRPASGSEHHLSHYFEITGILENAGYFPHGIDVAYSTVITERLREELLAIKELPASWEFDREKWENNIRALYHRAADGVIALQDKMGWYQKDYLSIYREKWAEICAVLSEVPASKELEELFSEVGLTMDKFYAMYGEKKVNDAVMYAKDLKDRYSVLWLYDLIKEAN
ncbi:MAG: sn-glycerol-1-phosphate dehydrogenase [Oscillospiraceae bacterium]|nr:sn-glycerol-1-phosphate dehydrogenase [Oscillospiraceae bacterium]